MPFWPNNKGYFEEERFKTHQGLGMNVTEDYFALSARPFNKENIRKTYFSFSLYLESTTNMKAS